MSRYAKSSMVLAALLVPGMVMATQTWVNSQNNQNWADAGNWNGGTVPVSGEDAFVNQGPGVAGPIVSTAGAAAGRLIIDGGSTVTVAAGGDLTASTQALLGNGAGSVNNTLLVDGGTLNVTTEFAVGNAGGAAGILTVNSGTVNANGGWLTAGNAGSGTITVNGGTVNVAAHLYLGIGGSGNVTINGGTVAMGGQLIGALTAGQTGNLTIAGGTTSAAVLDFANAGASTLDLTGGQLVIAGGLGQDADSTFNIGAGELLFTGLTLADVNWAIDNGAGTWTFAGANGNVRSVVDTGSGIAVTAIPEPATLGLVVFVGGAILGARRFRM